MKVDCQDNNQRDQQDFYLMARTTDVNESVPGGCEGPCTRRGSDPSCLAVEREWLHILDLRQWQSDKTECKQEESHFMAVCVYKRK